MSDNKKYYYLKIKDNFFDTDDMRILESMDNGYLYSNILMKLYLKSLKGDGRLMFKDAIPYNSKMLATITGHNVDHVEKAIKIFQDLNMIEILDNGAIYMIDIENFIGNSTSEADRIRKYRSKKTTEKTNLVQMYDKCTPELELDLELDLDLDLDLNNMPLKKPAKIKVEPLDKNGFLIDFSKWTNEDLQKNIKMVAEKKPEYKKEMLVAFYQYWVALNKKGVEIFKKEKSWSTASRLLTWFNNQNK